MTKARKKELLRRGIIIVGLCCVAYIIGCLVLPPLINTNHSIDTVLDLTESEGERICVVDDNEDAICWRLRLIQSAEQEIVLSTFDFRDDHSGQDMMAALLNAANRGVHIRILIDGFNGQLHLNGSDNFKALVSHENIEARFYNPISLTELWKANYRLHDKYLIIDDIAYLLGGRNTNDLFLGNYSDESNIDRDVVVYDDVVDASSSLTALKVYFEIIWNSEDNQMQFANPDSKSVAESTEALITQWEDLQGLYSSLITDIEWEAETITVNRITLLTGSPDIQNKAPVLWNTLANLMESGNDSILIQTPYLICNQSMYASLEHICSSAKSVQIMTNAVESGANPWGCSDYLNQKSNIINTGASVCEWMGDQSMHTKTILIDAQISIIGSYNLDARSTYLDTEIMLVIDSPELNAELRSQFESLKKQSKSIYPDGTETLGSDYVSAELPFGKKVLYAIMSVVVRPFRYLM